MDQTPFTVLSLCTGAGGLDLGIHLAVPDARVVCCVEHEAFACEVLASAMDAGRMDDAPVWTDLGTFNGKPWRGVVDCVVAGYPCTPFSTAGKRLGADDHRHLWPHVRRIVEEVGPGCVFFENVAGHLTLGYERVEQDLRDLGFRVEAGVFSAAETGAAHLRKRLFILGLADGTGDGRAVYPEREHGGTKAKGRAQESWAVGGELADTEERGLREFGDATLPRGVRHADGGDRSVADAAHERHERFGSARRGIAGSENERGIVADPGLGLVPDAGRGPQRRDVAGHAGEIVEIPDLAGLEGRVGEVVAGTRGRGPDADAGGPGSDVDLYAPGPIDPRWPGILRGRPDLAPALEPELLRMADGLAGRPDRLRCVGNGVVPVAAAFAFLSLLAAHASRDD